MGIIIAVIVSLLVLGGMVVAVMWAMRKSDPSNADTSTNDNISTAQEFLPFDDIKDGMILMGGHRYRAIIECSSTNYNLKTDREKEMIEISFQRFVNSLTFPITFFIQTKVIDNGLMLEMMEEEIESAIDQFPQLSEYGQIYFNEMASLDTHIGNNKQKKKYIIVPYEDAINLGDLNDAEKYEYSSKELYTRASMLVEGLSSVGVKARVLNTKELAEVIFSSYHKDNYTHVENVVNGEFLTLLTESETTTASNISEDARLDWILYEAQMRIQTELLNAQVPDFMKQNFEKSIMELDRLRDETSGYFKQRSDDYNQSFNENDAEALLNLKK
jgi:hypothetical protein